MLNIVRNLVREVGRIEATTLMYQVVVFPEGGIPIIAVLIVEGKHMFLDE